MEGETMSSEKQLSYEDIIARMKEKDFDEEDVIIKGSHPDGEEYLSEANQALRVSVKYIKEIEKISSALADGLSVK